MKQSALWMICLAAIAAVAAPIAVKHSGLRLNYTESSPVGLYRVLPDGPRYAGICLSKEVLDTAAKAGLQLEAGECSTGKQPVLKPIYLATPEAPVTFGPDGFTVYGKLLANTAPKNISRTGAPLSHVPFGTYPSGLWAISSFNRDSFDSRYFGPVPASSIRFYAVPFFLF